MKLLPREKDKLIISMAAMVARRRLERKLKLNHPEAVAIISDYILEAAREGKSVSEIMRDGMHVLSADQVMEGVPEMVSYVQVEATFPDGTKLVTIHNPIRSKFEKTAIPGEIIVSDEPIYLNEDRKTITLEVENTGDRPIQVGSHYHFYEVNEFLKFDRNQAYGFRLNILAGTGVRFEPGQVKKVTLVEYAGNQCVYGFNKQVQGKL